jgi:protein TonB
MFDQLLESKAEKQKRFGGGLISVIVHVSVIALAVVATSTAKEVLEKPKAEEVQFVEVKPDEPPPPEPEQAPPPEVVAAPPPPKGFQVLTAPVDIPDVIPDIDLTKSVTNEDDFSGRGVEGGIAKGVVGGTGPVTDQPFFEFQVEKPAIASQGNPPPRYPEILRGAGVEGETLVQFVVDTTGRADMGTFKVLKSDHDLFTNAVRSILPQYRFLAAETGGRKVKMYVQMPFKFNIQK